MDNKGQTLFLYALILMVEIILYGIFRDKAIKVTLESNRILINRFVGLGRAIVIENREIDGFYSSEIPTKYKTYHYIYLMKENRKIAKISNQYHTNFDELQVEIKNRFKDLGFIKDEIFSDLRDVFNNKINENNLK